MPDTRDFRTSIWIETFARPRERVHVDSVIVDPAVLCTWLPAGVLAEAGIVPDDTESFERADGGIIERSIGHALIRISGTAAPTLVVFAQPGDRIVLGAHALSGMRLRLDYGCRELAYSGPVSAAAA